MKLPEQVTQMEKRHLFHVLGCRKIEGSLEGASHPESKVCYGSSQYRKTHLFLNAEVTPVSSNNLYNISMYTRHLF